MSAASGIKVSPEVTQAWAAAMKDAGGVRALVLRIEGDAFHLTSTLPPSSSTSFKDDISLLPRDAKVCSTFVYRTDNKVGGEWEWMLITFVPDHAPVRSKMLHASSKSGLLKALGEGRFKENLFFTSADDLTPSSFSSHLSHLSSPPPLSNTEKALAAIKISEAEEASARVARLFGGGSSSGGKSVGSGSDPSGGQGPVQMGMKDLLNPARGGAGGAGGVKAGVAKGSLKWVEGVREAVSGLRKGGEKGMGVFLQIDPKTETLILSPSVSSSSQPISLSPSQLASKIPGKEPCYTFYAWPSTGKTKVAAAGKTSSAVQGEKKTEGESADGGSGSGSGTGVVESVVKAGEEAASKIGAALGKDLGAVEKKSDEGEEKAEDAEKTTDESTDVKAESGSDDKPTSPAQITSTSALTAEPESTAPARSPSPAPPQPAQEEEEEQAGKIAFIYTCPAASPVRYRMLYSSSLRGVMDEAGRGEGGIKIEKKLETSDISDLTETYLKSELFPTHSLNSGYQSHSAFKSSSADSGLRPTSSANKLNPARAATAISQSQNKSPGVMGSNNPSPSIFQSNPTSPSGAGEAQAEWKGSGGGLPESAFSAFGPRVNVGSPGGGGFARPKPAGRR